MSDPYGPPPGGQTPGGQSPYGNNDPYGAPPPPPPNAPPVAPPPAQPYGAGGGYGAPQNPYQGGYSEMPPSTDGISIAALVTSLLCCFAPIGIILGFVGLRRTKGGQRKGRGFAIAGIIIGVVMSLATAGGAAALFVFADSLVTPGNAEVGQCVDIDEEDGTVIMTKRECTEEHDAEIVGVQEVTADNRQQIADEMAGYCATAIDPEDLAQLSDRLPEIKAIIEDPNEVEVGDTIVCYVEPDEELNAPLL